MKENKYKLIIADDEVAIRRGLSKFGKWEELGFEIVAVFEDGSEIINYIKKGLEVDVILSDIVMNDCSGLDVLTYINENNISVKTILLSGYSDFENAQKAIKLGATEYLLKPTVLSELRTAFTKIKEELDEQRKIQKEKDLRKIYLEKILLNIISNPSQVDINELWNFIDIKSSHKDYYWINIFLETNEKHIGSNNEIESLIKNSLDFEKDWLVVTNNFSNTISILVLIPKDLSIDVYKNIVNDKVSSSVKTLTELFNYDISLNEIIIADNWKEMQLLVNSMNNKKNASQINIATIYTSETLFNAIKDYDYIKIKNFLNYAKGNTTQSYALMMRVAMILYLQIEHYHIDIGTESQVNDIKNVLNKDNNYKFIIEYIYYTIDCLENFLGQRKQIISKMYEYINLHIYDGITLQDISEYFNYNSSYLSRVFKESTGESFSTYLKRIKIQHAKALLNNPELKIYEISEKLGYRDVRHFYKMFKDFVEMTPTKYRKKKNIDRD